jgi:uridine kinase
MDNVVIASLRAAVPSAGATAVIAIDGRSGAGKSTLAAWLAAELGGVPVVALEDLYGGWDGLDSGIARLREDVLVPLAAGRPADVPRYDWHAGAWAEPWRLEPATRLVVEGVGAGARSLEPFVSMLVWVEAEPAVRRARTLARDGTEVYDEASWRLWAAQEDAYVAREEPQRRADIRLAGGEAADSI